LLTFSNETTGPVPLWLGDRRRLDDRAGVLALEPLAHGVADV
jgi:hypothetical protein